MRSRWQQTSEEHTAPVEMRFIDMFMTALGGLVFVALLLVFLLPKAARESDLPKDPEHQEMVPKKQFDDTVAQNKELQSRLDAIQQAPQQMQAEQRQSEDKDIVKRNIGVLLVTSGCKTFEPNLYVRWEGKLIDTETGKPASDAIEFDAVHSWRRTNIVGQNYADVGHLGLSGHFGRLISEPLAKHDLHMKLFYAISRASGSYSVYVGFSSIGGAQDQACQIHPIYLSSVGAVAGEQITMTRQRPFAWLKRFRINSDGTTTLSKPVKEDEEFKRDLAEFSKKQSDLLCRAMSLCGTVDAHYASLAPTLPSQALPGVYALSADRERALAAKESIKECDVCPELLVMPAGSFAMGSPDDEARRSSDEGPQRRISILRQFAVGKFAVTFDEWDACVTDGGCHGYRPSDEDWGRGRRPVINVSWDDAKSYVEWLTSKTGKKYRLLSETEREYVARAGTVTPFWWGSAASTEEANYDGNLTYGSGAKGKYERKTVPVDTFRPNPWGLYQVHGNVWEWVEDCWLPAGQAWPPDGQARSSETCRERARRGGSWRNNPQFLRSAVRGPSAQDLRSNNIGFRVARTLEQ